VDSFVPLVSLNYHYMQFLVLPKQSLRFVGSRTHAIVVNNLKFRDKAHIPAAKNLNKVLFGLDWRYHRIACRILEMAIASPS
jgi:hypothetical protein